MSETSATTSTSFINTSDDCTSKQPLSSDSSIDSGCSAMTSSDSIHINQQADMASNSMSDNIIANQRSRDGARINLSMLPPQPLAPPPPPPPQLNGLYYETSDVYGDRNTLQQQSCNVNNSNGSNNTNIYSENFYATYANSSRTSVGSCKDTNQLRTNKQDANDRATSSQISFQQTLKSQRLSSSSLESASSIPLMPMNVKGMLLHGLPSDEVLKNWLSSIKCDEYIENFIHHGYDIHLVTKMTPQDLAAVGCRSPALRKKLLTEIKKLNLDYEIPETDLSTSLEKWLETLKLGQYHTMLCEEGYETVEKACKLTWEDLEEIGLTKLGHQKRFLLGIEKINKSAKQREESQNDNSIYDIHPNHRVSLNGSQIERTATLGRVRSGFFQTRSSANLDHRGLPVATVVPALKHVNSPIVHTENKIAFSNDGLKTHNTQVTGTNGNNFSSSAHDRQIYDGHNNFYGTETLKLSDFPNSTSRRNPPPPPPLRTNSLKICQGNGIDSQSIYGTSYTIQDGARSAAQTPSSTSFLRNPKLGTLTATTNKMLTSGAHMQTIPSGLNSKIVPVREAPLPPTQQMQFSYQLNLIQTAIPEAINEEQAICSMTQQTNSYPLPPNCDGTNPIFNDVIGGQLADANEFPPPPPCQ